MSVSRLELVVLMEGEAAKLTPEGQDLAKRMELLEEAPPGGPAATYETQRTQADDARGLPPRDRNILERLLMLGEGIARSDAAERRGEPGGRYRAMAVTGAAGLKDRNEGRMIDPDMTPDRAATRLREPG
jgi:hypothetical protein